MLPPALASFLRHALLVPALAGALAAAAACSTVTTENYQRLQTGMTRDEVYSIIGKPDEVAGGGIDELWVSAETWRGRDRTIRVVFGGDAVAVKSIQLGDPEF